MSIASFRVVSMFLLAAVLSFSGGPASSQEIRVTLLGTGNPPPVMDRFGPSILVEAGDKKFLFDVGRGAIQRMTQIKVGWETINGVFFTHLHSDHVVGFPDAWLTGWLVSRRNRPLEVWGPPGTENMVSHIRQAFEFDIRFRISDDKAPAEGALVNTHEISAGVAYEQDGVRVTAIKVDHAPVEPAYGYRIDYAGRSVVLSGDTRISDNLIRAAKSVDLLVHEVASPESFQRAGIPAERMKTIVGHHVTPEQAGEVFEKAKPRLALYSHIVLPTATADDLVPGTRKNYRGPLEVGEDLMVIEVGKEIVVKRPSRKVQ